MLFEFGGGGKTSLRICLHKPLEADVSKNITDVMSGKSDIWIFDSQLHHTVMEAAKFFFM